MIMNTDKITLPGFLIADLYKDSLVDITALSNNDQQITEETFSAKKELIPISVQKIEYYGENEKNVTVVVNETGTVHLNREDLTFLSNILKACQLSIKDIAIVNTAGQQVTYMAIKEQLNAGQILLFDTEPSIIGLPFKIPPFQIQNYAGCTIVLAPALSALNKQTVEGKLLKTKLWNSLKQVFNI